MAMQMKNDGPVVSVIITCYNHGEFLQHAVESVLGQSYRNLDVIVVDDGSTDNTGQVARTFTRVRYVCQVNSGLAAARNRGLAESRGKYIVFLDADDFLYENAIEVNLRYMEADPSLAFVSGAHEKVDQWGYPLDDQEQPEVVTTDHYRRLLRGNYIGMHAAVMYARWVFVHVLFDQALPACEDYDLYFRIARDFPIDSHGHKVAAYRMHGSNMSGNLVMMYNTVMEVCRRQAPYLTSPGDREAFHDGLKIWGEYYASRLFHLLWNGLDQNPALPSWAEARILALEMPRKLAVLVMKRTIIVARSWLKVHLSDNVLRQLHKNGLYQEYTPVAGKIDMGDLDRATPFSEDFGFDRGGAIDRFYIERFIRENAAHIRGNVLEVGDNEYTLKYGDGLVSRSDILHVDSSNVRATYVGDITNIPEIPSARFDCIIFTQTLHLIYDFEKALLTCYRILKPGGALLLTVPGISNIDRGAWKDYWLWSFTVAAMNRLMKETFNGSSVEIRSYGNVLVAAAFLYGIGLPEIDEGSLLHNDPSYPLIVSVRAVKS